MNGSTGGNGTGRTGYTAGACTRNDRLYLSSLKENHDEVWTFGSRLSTTLHLLEERLDLKEPRSIGMRFQLPARAFEFLQVSLGNPGGTFIPETTGVDWGCSHSMNSLFHVLMESSFSSVV